MNQSDIHLLDLPNEILIIILKKLDNTDVLYSLCGINNERLDILVKDDVFTNTLNFIRTLSIDDVKLDRFYTYILPRSHHNIRKLILDTISMERILLAGDFPNLTFLELFNFGEEIIFRYFTDDSIFRHIFKHQITDLILHNNDEYTRETSLQTYTRNVYSYILALFENLKHLTIVSSSENEKYPPLSLLDLPPTTYFFSALMVLCINVCRIDDCLSVLDGRLKQLNTFIVQINYIGYSSLISRNTVS
ncbi:unnamed protein product [Rotaria sp. Silwood2]|nr:unnamed protein product [Rotaria sp. Silwood2]